MPEPWVRGYSKEARANFSKGAKTRPKRPQELIDQIAEKLKGTKHAWRPGTSRANAERGLSDTVYLMKMTDSNGRAWGKWGSTSCDALQYRENEFKRKRFTWEILLFYKCDNAPEIEEQFGHILCKFPLDPQTRPSFFGETETFEWTPDTQHIVNSLIQTYGNS